MSVGYVTQQSAFTAASGATTVFTGASFAGVNLALVLITSDSGSDDVTGVTINGASMALGKRTTNTGGGFTGMVSFVLPSPADGDVIVTKSGSKNAYIGLVKLSGADTATPCGTWADAGDNGGGTSQATGTITGVDATGLFVEYWCSYGGTAAPSYGGSETQRIETPPLTVATLPGAASANSTMTRSDAVRINAGGVYINAAAAVGTHNLMMMGMGS